MNMPTEKGIANQQECDPKQLPKLYLLRRRLRGILNRLPPMNLAFFLQKVLGRGFKFVQKVVTLKWQSCTRQKRSHRHMERKESKEASRFDEIIGSVFSQ